MIPQLITSIHKNSLSQQILNVYLETDTHHFVEALELCSADPGKASRCLAYS